jgi:GTP-binding protein EngB required for normal cell division
MTRSSDDRASALENVPVETTLSRLTVLATECGADHTASALRAVAERVSDGRFYVACVGQSKRGKSTLLNALIGESVLPAGVIPVTTVPTVLRFGRSIAARVRFDGTGWTDIGINAVKELVSEETNPENVKRVSGVEIFAPSPLLKSGMCLVDTPGLGSVFAGNARETHAFLPHIDAAIVVLGSDPPLSGNELELVETVASEVRNLLFVLNKADRASEAERAAAIKFACAILSKRLGRGVTAVFEVSALERLEARGPARDWDSLLRALQALALDSGSSLVRRAADRAIRGASDQLLKAIEQERESLQRPLEESERRVANMRRTLGDAESTLQDLGVLLAAEQQRLSEALRERRRAFLGESQAQARKALHDGLCVLQRGRNGPRYRRSVNHMAQDICWMQLAPWLETEARYAEAAFRKIARRFQDLGNDFLDRLRESGVAALDELPEDVGSDEGLRADSRFFFHVMERVAAPASPLLFVADSILGALGWRAGMVRNAEEFLDQLLEVNSSRIQADVDQRVQESRRKLESEIKGVLRESCAVSERALAGARVAQAAGGEAVERALLGLHAREREVRNLLASVAQ